MEFGSALDKFPAAATGMESGGAFDLGKYSVYAEAESDKGMESAMGMESVKGMEFGSALHKFLAATGMESGKAPFTSATPLTAFMPKQVQRLCRMQNPPRE